MNLRSKDTWLMLGTVLVFLIWKLSTLHYRFGDENVYFYMTKAIRDGLVPYKDFNLADPPVFVYLLTIFKSLIGSHLLLFKIWPPLFDSASATVIFLLLKSLGNRFAALGSAMYLFSFTVLSTSDYVTGAELMIFLLLVAFYLDRRGRFVLSGTCFALACLAKLYAAPALIGFLGYKLYKRDPTARKIIVAGIGTSVVVLLPFSLVAPHETILNLFVYQLHRPAGINKWSVFGIFFSMEWFLILAGIAGAFTTRYKLYIWPLVCSFVFLLWFKDLYYLYLHLLIPFLAILAAEFASYLSAKKVELAWGFILLFALALMYPLISYTGTYAPQGVFNNPEEIASALQNTPDNLPVYGVQEVAPLLALMANKPILDNAIDTNTQNFLTGALDRDTLSQDAARDGIYLVTRIADYPEQHISNTGFESYFDSKIFKDSCTLYKKFSRSSPGDPLNDVAIYRCQKSSS